jgi:hypothetical protein
MVVHGFQQRGESKKIEVPHFSWGHGERKRVLSMIFFIFIRLPIHSSIFIG